MVLSSLVLPATTPSSSELSSPASFDLSFTLVLSSDSRQLVYTTSTKDDYKICICDPPPDILAQARPAGIY
ncbi:hypothetical protein BDR05DRAFT_965264 [Suillus weaverae]|nr:hypothetical protein BDR05DRAFT_965264 [Suillus weaverae]